MLFVLNWELYIIVNASLLTDECKEHVKPRMHCRKHPKSTLCLIFQLCLINLKNDPGCIVEAESKKRFLIVAIPEDLKENLHFVFTAARK